MASRPLSFVFRATTVMLALGVSLRAGAADEPIEQRAARAALEYDQRIQEAIRDLDQARADIGAERSPLMQRLREVETSIGEMESEIARLKVEKARLAERGQGLRADRALLDRNLGFIVNVVADALKAAENNRLPGEAAQEAATFDVLRERIERQGQPRSALAALDAADALLAQVQRRIGGYTTRGAALREGDSVLLPGTLVYAGPAVFFVAESGEVAGLVRERRDSLHVVARPVAGWRQEQAEALARGEASVAPFDASSGKAALLLESHGSLLAEIRKGGVVGYVILGLGVIAVVLVVMKFADLRTVAVDTPAAMQDVTAMLARGDTAGVQVSLPGLKPTTRTLVATALRAADAPRALVEEQLEGLVMRQRLLLERRLPLLAVIATAGPLLGLLGTVTGMIKTFTLITVFGTGSAARLSGGISEALVATALGLSVAIPALLVHGLLSHRIHKAVSLLERHAVDLATALEEARVREPLRR